VLFLPGMMPSGSEMVRRWCSDADRTAVIEEYGLISSWDTSLVTDMSQLFSPYAVPDRITFNDDISNWNTAAVTNMNRIFQGATIFNGDISDWNTTAVMFQGATICNGDISNWDTTAVTDMGLMFYQASAFDKELCWTVGASTETNIMFEGTKVGSFGGSCE
jgi:surface protein